MDATTESRSQHPPRPPRQTAMGDGGGNDDTGQRARAGRGVKPSDHTGSPPRGPRHHPDNRPRHRQPPRPGPEPSHDRGRDGARRPSLDHAHTHKDRADLIPNYRPSQPRDHEPNRNRNRRGRSRDRGRPSSPSSGKRPRSPSPSSGPSHRKRHRKHASGRNRRVRKSDANAEPLRRQSPNRRRPVPANARSSPGIPDIPSSRSARDRFRRPDSPGGDRAPAHEERIDEQHLGSDTHDRLSRSRSPPPFDDSFDIDRPDVPPRDREQDPSGVDAEPGSDHEGWPIQKQNRGQSPQTHDRRRRRQDSAGQYSSARSEVDDEMASHGSYRGGYAPVQAHNHPYHDGPRTYSQSPQHAGSYHDSPSQSPYGGRGGWGNQISPQRQHSHYPSGPAGYGPPTGPSGSFNPNQPYPTTPQGGYRGGQRGGGFRGGVPHHGRGGGPRGSNFPNSQWVANNHGAPTQSLNSETSPERTSPVDENNENTPFESRRDSHTQLLQSGEQEDGPPRGPANRQPPTGPSGQNSKFSFAFKTAKPSSAAPKPGISQKFNDGLQRKPPSEAPPPPDRAPPPSAPTEPASARPRHESKKPPDGPRGDGPRAAPRMRKVKKIMKKAKPRPCLEAHLVSSESVFFRKPGNESVVGSGTYGKVFKALNVYTKGQVALKKIRMEGERDGFPVTAVREIKLLQSLRHLNIVNLQEVMVEKNDCFMVFEYLSHDLTGILNHPTFTLEAAQKKHLAKQLFEGLDYLHTRGVLHRDIKAANILVSNEGILKIADFGLARFYAKHHQLDYTNRVITIWYRSPELLLGETQYSAAVDVWSAACVMVEIFARQAIFPGEGTELSQLEKIYDIIGTPSRQDWPGLVDMAWFELLKPTAKKKNVFAELYADRVTPAAFELLAWMFRYDPAKRPTAAEVLAHAYFTTEEPAAKQAVELSDIGGDWHEFESKALRKENERKDREARKAQQKEAANGKDKKRAIEGAEQAREVKRVHVEKTEKPAAADSGSGGV